VSDLSKQPTNERHKLRGRASDRASDRATTMSSDQVEQIVYTATEEQSKRAKGWDRMTPAEQQEWLQFDLMYERGRLHNRWNKHNLDDQRLVRKWWPLSRGIDLHLQKKLQSAKKSEKAEKKRLKDAARRKKTTPPLQSDSEGSNEGNEDEDEEEEEEEEDDIDGWSLSLKPDNSRVPVDPRVKAAHAAWTTAYNVWNKTKTSRANEVKLMALREACAAHKATKSQLIQESEARSKALEESDGKLRQLKTNLLQAENELKQSASDENQSKWADARFAYEGRAGYLQTIRGQQVDGPSDSESEGEGEGEGEEEGEGTVDDFGDKLAAVPEEDIIVVPSDQSAPEAASGKSKLVKTVKVGKALKVESFRSRLFGEIVTADITTTEVRNYFFGRVADEEGFVKDLKVPIKTKWGTIRDHMVKKFKLKDSEEKTVRGVANPDYLQVTMLTSFIPEMQWTKNRSWTCLINIESRAAQNKR
jgi:hypothetical protein